MIDLLSILKGSKDKGIQAELKKIKEKLSSDRDELIKKKAALIEAINYISIRHIEYDWPHKTHYISDKRFKSRYKIAVYEGEYASYCNGMSIFSLIEKDHIQTGLLLGKIIDEINEKINKIDEEKSKLET